MPDDDEDDEPESEPPSELVGVEGVETTAITSVPLETVPSTATKFFLTKMAMARRQITFYAAPDDTAPRY